MESGDYFTLRESQVRYLGMSGECTVPQFYGWLSSDCFLVLGFGGCGLSGEYSTSRNVAFQLLRETLVVILVFGIAEQTMAIR
jgi:hypothetical protein